MSYAEQKTKTSQSEEGYRPVAMDTPASAIKTRYSCMAVVMMTMVPLE